MQNKDTEEVKRQHITNCYEMIQVYLKFSVRRYQQPWSDRKFQEPYKIVKISTKVKRCIKGYVHCNCKTQNGESIQRDCVV